MMKRVGVARLTTADDQPPLIITTASQIQQQQTVSGVNVHAQQSSIGGLHENPTPHQTTIIVSTQQVINYSKEGSSGGGTLQYAGSQYSGPPTKPPPPAQSHHQSQHPRHKGVVGNQSPGAPVQVTVGTVLNNNSNAIGPPGSVVPGSVGTQFQRLKVEDALSYLDKVKFKFNNQPQVYNDFLDIMKEFKSQSIDTPGVIARVSNLFKGHPELIVGFNTFLPPGYKIEVQANNQGFAYQVSVSMPSPNSCALQHPQGHSHLTHPGSVLTSAGNLVIGTSQSVQPSQTHQQHHHLVQILPGSGASAIVHNLSTGATTTGVGSTAGIAASVAPPIISTNTLHHISQAHQQLEAPAPPPPNSSSQPVEFNHAIEYVNKIKNRFNRQPEKYKRFLEILHAYQRGQKELNKEPQQVKQQSEQEVYAQVAKLFENQDDLLVEFGQFLPDATGGGGIGGAAIKATAALDAARAPDQARPRPTTHPPSQRNIETMMIETDSPVYHTVAVGRAPSPGYNVSTPSTQPAIPQPAPVIRTERDVSSSHHIQSSQTANQHSSSQVSSHHPKHLLSSAHVSTSISSSTHHLKRSPSFSSSNQIGGSVGPPPPKKHKLLAAKDVSFAEAAKYGSLGDFSFFDRVRKALRSQEVYDNFLRCLLLFTNEIVSKSELLAVTAPFFSRNPELQRWLQEFLGLTAGAAGGSPPTANNATSPPPAAAPVHTFLGNGSFPRDQILSHPTNQYSLSSGYSSGFYSSGGERYTGENNTLGPLGAQLRQDRPQGDAAMEIDLTTCRRLGTSYCALPKASADSPSRRCSGRTPLCREVLNETWVSFPTWSEDSTFVTSRKTQFEEYIYRCEDERFELDVVIETNASTILVLEGVHKKLCRMCTDEATRFRLDDCLGGTSPTIHQRALRRIYGEKANDIISGLKKNPLVAVPIVLRRLKAKEEEWREAQKGFNKQWREVNEKYYLKSLDYQGVNFKQNDLKALRSKSLFNEIETIYDERREQIQSNVGSACGRATNIQSASGPHLLSQCGPGGSPLLADAADLLIHHVRRQTAIQKQEKQRVKQLLRQFLPDLFSHPRYPLSDDERDDDDKDLDVAMDSPGSGNEDGKIGSIDNEDGDARLSGIRTVKHEKEVSSESDTNVTEKPSARIVNRQSKEEKAASRENKENLKCSLTSRNNSADSVDKDMPKGDTNSSTKTSSRRREGSTDSNAKVKSEPMELKSSSDNTNSLSTHLNMKDINRDMNDLKDKNQHPVVFFGNLQWYVFLRLHSILCQRLAAMKTMAEKLAEEESTDVRLRRPATAVALRLKPDNAIPVSQYYSNLLDMIRSVLDGNTEASVYEDNLREMFGVNAYIAFTLDKVVSYAVRQLQQCVQERIATKCVELHIQERARVNSGSPSSIASYQRRAQKLLRDDPTFKICIFGGDDCKVTFELLESGGGSTAGGMSSNAGSESAISQNVGNDSPAPPAPPARLAEWARYRERYTNPAIMDTELPDGVFKDGQWFGRKAIFLPRNIRRFNKLHPNNGRLSMSRDTVAPSNFDSGINSFSPPSQITRRTAPSSDEDDDNDNDNDNDNSIVPNKRKKITHNKEYIPAGVSSSKDPTNVKDWSGTNSNMTQFINEDKTEGLFDKKANCKFVYILNKEQFMYKKDALKRAWKCHKSVSRSQECRWRSWLGGWCSRHVSTSQARSATDWLKRGTRTLSIGSPDAPPYTSYNRYRLANTPPHAPDR